MSRSDRLPLILMLGVVIAMALVFSLLNGMAGEGSGLDTAARANSETEAPDRDRSDPARRRIADSTTPALPAEPAAEQVVEKRGDASLTIEFRCPDAERTVGIVVDLQLEGRPVGRAVSDEAGRVVFTELGGGRYRWRHDGSRPIIAVPAAELSTMMADGERVAVRPGADLLSGPIEIAAGQQRSLIVPFDSGGVVTGRVSDELGPLTQAVALKLISRERFVHPGGTEVERIVGRQAQRFESGEFRFANVRAGELELLGYFASEGNLAQIRLAFHLEAGERVDLGAVMPIAGRDLLLRLAAVDPRGDHLPVERVFGREQVMRVVEVMPEDPDETWPYQKIELPMDREVLLRGLPDGPCRLRLTEEDGRINEAQAGWRRITSAELAIPGSTSDSVVLEEVWGRESILDLLPVTPGPGELLRPRLQLIDLDHGLAIEHRLNKGFSGCRLRLVEGRYRVILGGQVGDRFLQCDSGVMELGEGEREQRLILQSAGRIIARPGPEGKLRLEEEKGGPVLEFSVDADGRVLADLPPGRYRVYGQDEILLLEAGTVVEVGDWKRDGK